MDLLQTLYPDWEPPTVLPTWITNNGLSKNPRIVGRTYASAGIWKQAEEDNLKHIAPLIVQYNDHPSEIKKIVGSATWKNIHHSTLRANINRMVLCMIGGWTQEEAMLFPPENRRKALPLLKIYPKTVLITACRLVKPKEDIAEVSILINDTLRMGGEVPASMGRKRLQKLHDELAARRVYSNADNTPWAKPWFCEVDGYSFALLKTQAELILEGRMQRHCVGSYAHACRAGRQVVLSITGPTRATCSWDPRHSHIQVKGFANKEVSIKLKDCVCQARRKYEEYRILQSQKKGGPDASPSL